MNKAQFLSYDTLRSEFQNINILLGVTDDDVAYLMASGNVLSVILDEISGIPKPLKQVSHFTWYGDVALIIKDYLDCA